MAEKFDVRRVDGKQKVLMRRDDLGDAHLAAVAEGLRHVYAARNNGAELMNPRCVTLPTEMVEKYQRKFLNKVEQLRAQHPTLPHYAGVNQQSLFSLAAQANPDLWFLGLAEKCEEPWQSDVDLAY